MASSRGSCRESCPSFLNSYKSPVQGLAMLKSRHIPSIWNRAIQFEFLTHRNVAPLAKPWLPAKLKSFRVSEILSYRVAEFPSYRVSQFPSFQVSKGGREGGPRRGLELISGPMRGLKKCIQWRRQTDTRTSRLYDWIGPVWLIPWKYYIALLHRIRALYKS